MRGPGAPLESERRKVGRESAREVSCKLCESRYVVDGDVACFCARQFPVEVYGFVVVLWVFLEELLGVGEAVVTLLLSGSFLGVYA